MASSWLRLWHDMPNDPKWRTIARLSGQPISLVQALYLHLLVEASRNVTRGHVLIVTEDLASALDADEKQIESIISAMEDRVLKNGVVTGWEKRQPKREEGFGSETRAKSSAERKRDQREREKASRESHDMSRGVTHVPAPDTDTDTDTEEDQKLLVDAERQPDDSPDSENSDSRVPPCPAQAIVDLFHKALPELPRVSQLNDLRRRHLQARWRENPVHQDLEFWADYFTHVKGSRFLIGNAEGRNGGKPFRATFDWLIAPSNFVKVIEGNYHA